MANSTDNNETRRFPSPFLALAGVAAMLVAVWSLAGWSFSDGPDPRWVFVGVAAIIGIVLVAIPARRKKN